MSEDVANAIITLLNAGACPECLQDATEDIADVEFILIEDLVREQSTVSGALH